MLNSCPTLPCPALPCPALLPPGFLPYNQLAGSRQSAIDPMNTLSYLVGQTIKAKVVAVSAAACPGESFSTWW